VGAHTVMISRRDIIRLCASLWAAPLIGSISLSSIVLPSLKAILAKEFPKSTVRAISPDGTRLCLEDWSERGYPLRVLETASWRTIYTGHFRCRSYFSSFFVDGQALFVAGPGGAGENATWWDVVDLASGEHLERRHPFHLHQGNDGLISTAFDRNLLVMQTNSSGVHETLALIEFASQQEILKVPYATQTREPRRRSGNLEPANDFGYGISDDRKILAYSFDHVLLCRRMSDFQILWTRQLESNLVALPVVVSASGRHVAATLTDFKNEYNLAVYDGKTGTELARFPIKGIDGVALSPDGKLVAIVERVYSKGKILPTIHIYDVSTGERLASLTHDTIKRGRHQFLEAGCAVNFTSDAKYLITSGMATRIWSLQN